MVYEGTAKLGDYFRTRKNKGKAGLPLLSVTLDQGLVDRDTLDRKMDSNADAEYHLLVKKGELAYNMMRMWQGAVGVAEYDGIVSPAYIVLTPNKEIDPHFAYHLFKSKRYTYLFWAYSYGLTDDRLRLYFKDFSKIPINLPPLEEQQKIAAILGDWDQAIGKLEQLLAAKRTYKRGLIQHLLTGKMRFPEFSDEWQEYRLGDLFKERRESKPDLSLLAITREKGVISRDELERKDTSNEDKSKYLRICPGDIGYNTMRMWQGVSGLSKLEGIISPAYTVCIPNNKADGEFMAYFFKFEPIVFLFYRYSQGLTSDTWNLKFEHFKEINVTIPGVEEQRRIAAVLAVADAEIAALERQLAAFRQQKRGLMQQLLTGKTRVKVEG